MKKILILVILMLGIHINAQTHRFIYELQYRFEPNGTNYDKEEMVLDINPDEVKFYESEFLASDSLNILHGGISSQHTSQSRQTIIRKRNSNKNKNFVQIMMMPYYYVFETEDNIRWKIEADTKKINNYNLQRATAVFGGRNWNAWFTPDINIPEGPYKFRGLPGLVLYVEDDKKDFIYSFSRNRNLPKTYDTKSFLEKHYSLDAIAIDLKKWVKLNLEFYNDPYARMRTEFQPDWNVRINGQQIKSKEEFAGLTKQTQIDIKKYYNPIELDKAIPYP
ncbi:GLPGLI family protein [Chryseobacterium bernardetii]|uniref:GLPGLI family protein n=2 Tax=Chryseobacterium TaxID=59732 RepID=A0A543DV47_9FLAO|nr:MULTISPECIES: GLPGLI family protein [Chryseobacterium]MDR6373095.1 GLPGLI family protein [Chryseobacterium vietnamense]MDR6443533.1 GLPGLI family protein [Chryseobacterium bernardetii]TQM13195.1 GLPGLI family protein [Chryseobacterium aquifrigidense]